MRLKSEIWIAALLRRCQTEGQYGAVVYSGAAEAGAIYVCINHLDGSLDLLGPAPGPAYDDNGERRFILEFANPTDWPAISALLDRRRIHDADFWLVEIEDRKGLAGLTPEKI